MAGVSVAGVAVAAAEVGAEVPSRAWLVQLPTADDGRSLHWLLLR